jgi:hypothetical protein
MGLKKFKSFEEARRDQWTFEPDQLYYQRIRKFYQFAAKLSPPVCKAGFIKFRDITEAQQHVK